MKRVLFFTHNLAGGGAEKTILNLLTYINDNVDDVEAYFCSCFPNNDIQNNYQNIIVLRHQTSPSMNFFQKLFTVLNQIFELRKIKRDLCINVSISFLLCSDYINVFSGIGERKISSVRNMESNFTNNVFQKWFYSFIWKQNSQIVSISQSVKQDLISYYNIGERKITTIYNPLPQVPSITSIGSSAFERELHQETRILVTVGRLTIQKGQWHLINAIAYLVNELKYQDIRLFILGKGELENTLKELVQQNKLENHVFFEGYVNNPQYYIKHAELFVFPSLCEGLGNVLVETLACGTAIISADCPSGPRELLAPQTDFMYQTKEIELAEYGILVPPFESMNMKCFDTQEHSISNGERILGDAIKLLLDDSKLRNYYCEQALKRSKAFTMDNIYSQWENVMWN